MTENIPSHTKEKIEKFDAKERLCEILCRTFCQSPDRATKTDWLNAVIWLMREIISYKQLHRKDAESKHKPKFVNYLSMEFLIGKTLEKTAVGLGIYDKIKEALEEVGHDFDSITQIEPEPALGNGGLGRLAACFMDSMATLGIPTFGYGIRYEYGMFTQKIDKGQQIEVPDTWLRNGFYWEFPRHEIKYLIPMASSLIRDENGVEKWIEHKQVFAKAHDIIIHGYQTDFASRIRLWSAMSSDEIVLDSFKIGDYARAFFQKNNTENISGVLYPDDSTDQGKMLRLQQEYFFSSASIQDIIYRFLRNEKDFNKLPEHCAVHLNDTHPSLAVPELMRELTQVYGLKWEEAWGITKRVFSYTNHTLMPEALESWEVDLIGKINHSLLDVIYRINETFLSEVRQKTNNADIIRNVSLVEESFPKKVRMAHLSIAASHKINGVSEIHSRLMKKTIFHDFNNLYPEKFINITNGVTPRRWLQTANPELSTLLDDVIGGEWRLNLNAIGALNQHVENAEVQQRFDEVKQFKKQQLAKIIRKMLGIEIRTDSIFDMQIKRIHLYKRQLMNILHVIHRYISILSDPTADWQPRTHFFAGKAASSYYMAKLIIRFIHDVADTINNDKRVSDVLKVVFVPNYGVSLAEKLIPAADISEQISTAGTEASGTSNMKFALNGALTVGTYDGATVEMVEKTGFENMFIFGKRVEEIEEIRSKIYDPFVWYEKNPDIRKIVSYIRHGFFSTADEKRYNDLLNYITNDDHFMILPDFQSYCEAHQKIDSTYKDKAKWNKTALINVANMGSFSSDESIRNYADKVWGVEYSEVGKNLNLQERNS